MKGFVFRICTLLLCVALPFCACQKAEEEVTTTTVPQSAETTTVPETTLSTTAAETQLPVQTTQKKKPVVTTTKASKQTTAKQQPEKPAEKPSASGTQTGFESEMLKAVNEQRRANGLSALTLNQSVCAAARVRAAEIAKDGCFSHTRPDGSGCFTALWGISYSTAGENIAMGTWPQYDVDKIMDGWMHSEGHRANILNADFSEAGFGCVVVNGNGYWVQLFIG